MDYNKTTVAIGKVRAYDTVTGEIVSNEGIYMFTQEGISEGENLSLNDTVLFRGEEVQNVKVAYFIKKINPAKDLNNQFYKKTKHKRFLKENE